MEIDSPMDYSRPELSIQAMNGAAGINKSNPKDKKGNMSLLGKIQFTACFVHW